MVGFAPVIPVGHATLREHNGAQLGIVYKQSANGTLVLRVHRAIAVGIAHHDHVLALLGHLNIKFYGSGSLVGLHEAGAGKALDLVTGCVRHLLRCHRHALAGHLDSDGGIGNHRLGGKRGNTAVCHPNHLIFMPLFDGEGGGIDLGNRLTVSEHNVVIDVFDGIPAENVALAAHDGGQRRLCVGLMVDSEGLYGLIIHEDFHLDIPLRIAGDVVVLLRLAVHLEVGNLVAVAMHGYVEQSVAVAEIAQRAGGAKRFRHKGAEREPVLLIIDTEENLMRQRNVAAQAPEHV